MTRENLLFDFKKAGLGKSYLRVLESNIRKLKPIYFCHNDLHNGNILKSESGLTIIDFDHANYGYRGFDLAYWLHHTVVTHK